MKPFEKATGLKTPPQDANTPATELKTPPQDANTPAAELKTPPVNSDPHGNIDDIVSQIQALGSRINDVKRVKELILKLCAERSLKATEIAKIFNREEDYFKRKYLTDMIIKKKLAYKYPDMINHPEQAYITVTTSK